MAPAVVLSAAGVLLVSVAYAFGRHAVPSAMVVYWCGQVLVLVPIVVRVLQGSLRERSAFGLVIWLALTGYLVKWAYNPDRLRFGDEVPHATHFPGLSDMGAAVTTMTRLPLTVSAFLVAGVLHLAVVGTIFVLVRRCGAGPTTAALTCVVYATGLHFLSFDSTYAYQIAALPFLVLALWAARGGPLWVGVLAVAVTTATHPVTALVLVAALLLVAGCTTVLLSPAAAREIAQRTWQLAAIAVVCVALWLRSVAPEAFGFLWQPLTDLVTHPRSTTADSPTWIVAIEAAGIVGLGVSFGFGVRAAIRWRIRDPWQIATLLAASVFFIGVLVRIVWSGPEVAARAATFTYLPVAAITAAVVLGRRARVPGLALILVLALGARLGGWPPADALLPGPSRPAAQGPSVNPVVGGIHLSKLESA